MMNRNPIAIVNLRKKQMGLINELKKLEISGTLMTIFMQETERMKKRIIKKQ